LLVLAFPTRVVGSHLIAIHGFFQVLLAVILVILAVVASTSATRSFRNLIRPAATALTAGFLTAVVLGLTYNRALFQGVSQLRETLGHGGHDYMDPQGALLVMAPYQLGLFVALWLAWSPRAKGGRLLLGLATLVLSQVIVLMVLGEWSAHTDMVPHVAAIRAWSVVSVLALAAWLLAGTGSPALRQTATATQTQHG